MKAWTLVCCLFISGVALSAQAQSEPTPTRFVHVNRDKEAVRRLYTEVYVPAMNVPQGWKDLGNCNPGTLSPATLKARLAEINYFRKMAGVPAVTLDPEMSKKAQAASFLMYKNGALSHNPPTTWKCYSAEAAAGAGSSNLGYGGGGISTYMTDFGESNQSCGHRMWLLKAKAGAFGYGGTNSTSAVSVFGAAVDRDSLPQYVAWPPAGFVPAEIISNRWTFSVPGEWANFAKATVQLTLNGVNIPLLYSSPTEYGDGGISFEIKDWDKLSDQMLDQKVKVSIKNVVVGDETRSFAYEVAAFEAVPSAPNVISYYNDTQDDGTVSEVEVEEEPRVLPFSERKLTALTELSEPSELPQIAFEDVKTKVAKDMVFNTAFCKFATQVSALRRDKKPDPIKLNAWATNKIKLYLARQAGLDEAQAMAAEAPKFMLVEITKLIALDGQESFGEIAAELAEKFAANPELKSFALKYKRIRQCGIGLAVKRVDRNGQAFAGVYATLVLAPAGLRVGS